MAEVKATAQAVFEENSPEESDRDKTDETKVVGW